MNENIVYYRTNNETTNHAGNANTSDKANDEQPQKSDLCVRMNRLWVDRDADNPEIHKSMLRTKAQGTNQSQIVPRGGGLPMTCEKKVNGKVNDGRRADEKRNCDIND